MLWFLLWDFQLVDLTIKKLKNRMLLLREGPKKVIKAPNKF